MSPTLPILPLPRGVVLLPGLTLRIPVAGRSDVLSLLTSIAARSKTPRPDAAKVPIGCVPLKSPLLSLDGQRFIEAPSQSAKEPDHDSNIAPGSATREDLFAYGTVAKISGVHGPRPDNLTLVVEGLRRFEISTITQEKPFFEAEVRYLEAEGIQPSYAPPSSIRG